jgi:hypothetical protein
MEGVRKTSQTKNAMAALPNGILGRSEIAFGDGEIRQQID